MCISVRSLSSFQLCRLMLVYWYSLKLKSTFPNNFVEEFIEIFTHSNLISSNKKLRKLYRHSTLFLLISVSVFDEIKGKFGDFNKITNENIRLLNVTEG